jgi:tetratricopeptide (TPR) repeat protein
MLVPQSRTLAGRDALFLFTRGARSTIVNWEERLAALWATFDEYREDAFLDALKQLVAERPTDDPVALFELAGAHDSIGDAAQAVALYRRALDLGLDGVRRWRAVIQLASSLRNVGQAEEGVALLRAEQARGSDGLDDAVGGFLALLLVDTGRAREAVGVALTALAPHLPRYQRSLLHYARDLTDDAAR